MNPLLKYGLVASFAYSAFLSVKEVGKPRRPTTSNDAALLVLVSGALIYLLLAHG